MRERTVEARIDIIRNGAKAGELKIIDPPRVRMQSTASIKTSLSATVKHDDFFDPLSDELRPVLIIDGVESPAGYFLPATVTSTAANGEVTDAIEAYDLSWRVETTLWLPGQKISAGTNYIAAVESLLVSCGISLVVKTVTTSTLPHDVTYDAGTSLLTVINDLLGEINYGELWFDNAGYARLEPFAPATADNIDMVLNAADVRSLLLPELTEEMDIFSAPNVFTCICSTPDRSSALVATAENTNPASPLSIPRRGRRIQSFVQVNEIASQTALNAYAERLCWESMAFGETVMVSTGILPGWGVQDVVALQYGDYSGLYLSNEWDMEITAGGMMSHTLKRVVITG